MGLNTYGGRKTSTSERNNVGTLFRLKGPERGRRVDARTT
jgi:hypothetical protein